MEKNSRIDFSTPIRVIVNHQLNLYKVEIITPSNTVDEVIRKIVDELGLPTFVNKENAIDAFPYYLIHNGAFLDKNKPVTDCNIKDGDELVLGAKCGCCG